MACGIPLTGPVPDWTMIRGAPEPPPQGQDLRAGRLSATLEGTDLVSVRAGDVELVRRMGVRVRDPRWGTLPATIEDLAVDQRPMRFEASFRAAHDDGRVRFAWQAAIAAESDTLTYEMDGAAEPGCSYARIGLVLIPPPALTAGRPYRARGPAGETS